MLEFTFKPLMLASSNKIGIIAVRSVEFESGETNV
jgi:hypothetical protein